VNRIIEAAPEKYPQQPFHYLLGCYSRAADERRSIGQDAAGQQLRAAVDACRPLLVSYAGLILMGAGVVPEVSAGEAVGFATSNAGMVCVAWTPLQITYCRQLGCVGHERVSSIMFCNPSSYCASHFVMRIAFLSDCLCLQCYRPQPDAANARGPLQLLDAMDCVISRQTMMQYNPPAGLGSITPLPHGFLADLAAAQDTDALQSILAPLGTVCLRIRVGARSA
jgi:hypothetical protein